MDDNEIRYTVLEIYKNNDEIEKLEKESVKQSWQIAGKFSLIAVLGCIVGFTTPYGTLSGIASSAVCGLAVIPNVTKMAKNTKQKKVLIKNLEILENKLDINNQKRKRRRR